MERPCSIASRLVVIASITMSVSVHATQTDAVEVCACVEEIPGEGGCSFIGTQVTLEPLGLQAVGPEACFPDVPPGDYTLQASCGSNPFGCPRRTHVTVLDADVRVFIPAVSPCAGHCVYGSPIRISDLIRCVRISQEGVGLSTCWACDRNYDDLVSVDELILAVAGALDNCTDRLPFH
jgi:hypothetical protein